MNYIWDVSLKAREQGIALEALRFVPAKSASPYIEASFENLNEDSVEKTVEINPLYRFCGVFSQLMDINVEEYPQLREALLDVYLHYIVRMDLRQGLCKDEYYMRFLLRDILSGLYGAEHQNAAEQFTTPELKKVLMCLLCLLRIGPSVNLFRKAMRSVYPDSLVYLNNDHYRELLIYIGCNETAREREKLDFLLSVFLSVNYTTHLFWEHHFGIIDVEATMQFDEMVIF